MHRLLSHLDPYVWPGLTLFIASTPLCAATSRRWILLLPGNRIKQWSQWDIAGLMDSPPPLPHLRFSCAKVFIESWWRQPCMTPNHLNGPEKKMRIFHTPAELAENNSGGSYWISIFISRWCKCLFTVLMRRVMARERFWLIFAVNEYIQHFILFSHTNSFLPHNTGGSISLWELFAGQAVLLTPQTVDFHSRAKLYSAFLEKGRKRSLIQCFSNKGWVQLLSSALYQLLLKLWTRAKRVCLNLTLYLVRMTRWGDFKRQDGLCCFFYMCMMHVTNWRDLIKCS